MKINYPHRTISGVSALLFLLYLWPHPLVWTIVKSAWNEGYYSTVFQIYASLIPWLFLWLALAILNFSGNRLGLVLAVGSSPIVAYRAVQALVLNFQTYQGGFVGMSLLWQGFLAALLELILVSLAWWSFYQVSRKKL